MNMIKYKGIVVSDSPLDRSSKKYNLKKY